MGEQDFCFARMRSDADPALALTKIGVFKADEADPREEGERLVIVRDQQCDVGKAICHASDLSDARLGLNVGSPPGWGAAAMMIAQPPRIMLAGA
jgi:hypothetical protein